MSRKTMVAYDGSPQAKAALRYALEEYPEAEITAVHVIRLPEGYWTLFVESEEDFPGRERAEAQARDLLDEADEMTAGADRSLETVIVKGEPAQELVDYAIDNDFDQIVMGSHGRQGASRLLFGSVAEKVVRRAPMTVVVVHETE
ncbi:universal stress protein [Halopiger aswanensis]|uniref:Nucleotide-binding universal stress UspA family protein n=1 Tax=Halopiger aswanensis TaxID=148449 RepID=A0A3R7GLT9_9EURY|nr:universal stress protein [Halopiger aswanensis]RKD98229.1 nucleotide-binding universal stress UspA family protein [Halopiger aswanensis]